MFTGEDFKTAVLLILGNIFIIILAVRTLGHWMKREWGEMTAHIVGAILVAFVVYAPDTAVSLLNRAAETIFR